MNRLALFSGILTLICVSGTGDSFQENESEWIQRLYSLTQSAKSAGDYSTILDACRSASTQELTEKNRAYVRSLMAWAASRRGETRLDLSQDFMKAGNKDQAIRALEQAQADFDLSLENDPQRWRGWLGRGLVAAHRGDLNHAIDCFSKVCELDSQDGSGQFNRAELYYDSGRFELALADYEHVLKVHPADIQAVTGKAHCLAQMGQRELAMKEYDMVCRLAPEHGMARLNRAEYLKECGQDALAKVDYEKALELNASGAPLRFAKFLCEASDPEVRDLPRSIALAGQELQSDRHSVPALECLLAAHQMLGNQEQVHSVEKLLAAAREAAEETVRAAAHFELPSPIKR